MFESCHGIIIISFFIMLNIPLGWWRHGLKKFSPLWFLAIHATVPFEIATRLLFDIPKYYIPLFIAAIIIGQYIGVRLRLLSIRKKVETSNNYD